MRQGWTRVYLDQVESPREVRMTVTIGRPYPLHAAVLHPDGTPFGSISVCGPITRFDERTRVEHGPKVAEMARHVSKTVFLAARATGVKT